MRIITSKDNQIIKEVSSLREKKYRDKLGMYLIEGPNLVKELMDFGGRPRFIFTKVGANAEIQNIVGAAEETSTVYELTEDVFDKISDTKTPQGIIAVADKIEYSENMFFSAIGDGNILVLDRLQDPGNVGTLIRLSEAMDFKGVIFIKGTADPYQPKVVRSAAGAILRVPMLFLNSAEECINLLKRYNKKTYAAFMDAELKISEVDLKNNVAIVIGNEGSGVSKDFEAEAEKLMIPMSGKTESLNAAIAGTIIMYESKRQRS